MLPTKLAERQNSSRLTQMAMFLLSLFLCANTWASPGDLVFVTQVPFPEDFANLVSTFGNQKAGMEEAPRGGDLYIRYADGTLKNLTQAAGFGNAGAQASNAIAVRDPVVHWSGNKVLFSMVVGAPTRQYDYSSLSSFRWQLYEIIGLGRNDTPVITKVPGQPAYNNIMPAYGSDDSILFSSDRPRNGAAHLYPQRDEYESTATNTGLWKLNPTTAELVLLDHSPSGIFHPIVDSFGRVIYTRWDHMQRDQQNMGADSYGAFNYSSEAENSVVTMARTEVFPEARSNADRTGVPGENRLNNHSFNHFLPWMIHQDGSGLETLNHVGRHELVGYIPQSFNDDPNLVEFYDLESRFNNQELDNFFQIRESATSPGLYYGIRAPEFGTHASGQVVTLNGPPSLNPDSMPVTYITHPETANASNTPTGAHSGLYRNPLPLSDGGVVVAHTSETRADENIGNSSAPRSRYEYRLKRLQTSGNYQVAGTALTSGISKTVSWWTPDVQLSYSGNLWELQPVELIARARPSPETDSVDPIEQAVFAEEGVSVTQFQEYLKTNQLALIVGRNVTTRDAADKQQPFNLRRAGTETKTIGASGKIYDVDFLQIFQGDLIRGYRTNDDPSPGRRVLAQPLHDSTAFNPASSGPSGSVSLGSDGSFAAFVPARRALTWQLTDSAGQGVVRERLWLTFQPGEIRTCTSCHGINSESQSGRSKPLNKPEALRSLLAFWRTLPTNPGDTKPAFVLRLKKKKPAPKVALSVLGQNAAAASRQLELRATVNGKACPKVLRKFSTNSAGAKILNGALPQVAKKARVVLLVHYQGESVASTVVTLRKSGDRSALGQGKICSALRKLR